jgi:hypothetical protein
MDYDDGVNDVDRSSGRSGRFGGQGGCATWALAAAFAASAAAVLLAATIFLTGVREGRSLLRDPLAPIVGPQPTAELATESVVIQQLREASELTTAVFTMETVVSESQDRQIAGLTIGRTRLLYVAHGDVRAGVDLEHLGSDAVEVDGPVVRVTLPPPRIQDVKIDVERSYVIDIDKSLFAPADRELQTRAERFALGRIREAACEADILAEANLRAELTVRTLLVLGGYTNTVIQTRSAPESECGPVEAPTTTP